MLGDARELTLQVWDHDTISRNDLIGETHLTLPDLASLLRSGSRRSEVPQLELFHPPLPTTPSPAIYPPQVPQLELFHPQANHDASKKSLAGP